MVIFTKLRLDIVPPLKQIKHLKQEYAVPFAAFNDADPKPNFRPVNSVAFQPHFSNWEYERLAVAAGHLIHIWAIKRTPLTQDAIEHGSAWSHEPPSELKEVLRKQFMDHCSKWKSYNSSTMLQKKKLAEQITQKVKSKRMPIPDFPWTPIGEEARRNEQELGLNRHPPTMLLATVECHGRNNVDSVVWAPSGQFAASQDAQAVCLWFFGGSNVQHLVPENKVFQRSQPDAVEKQYVAHVVKGPTFGSRSTGVDLERWTHKATIRSSGTEFRDIAFLDDRHLAVATTDKIDLFGIDCDTGGSVSTTNIKSLDFVDAFSGTIPLSMTVTNDGNVIAILCSDHTVRSWRLVPMQSHIEKEVCDVEGRMSDRRAQLRHWERLDSVRQVFGDPQNDLLLTKPRLSCNGMVLAIPLGSSTSNNDNFPLIGRWSDLRRVTKGTMTLQTDTGRHLLTRLRGHRTRVNLISIGPAIFCLRPPDVMGDRWSHPLMKSVLQQARLIDTWPLFSIACAVSTDGGVSFWRVFHDPRPPAAPDGETQSPDAPGSTFEPIESSCFLVLTPRFVDEQATVSDVSWSPDGTGCVIGADDGSLTAIGFQSGEIGGTIVTCDAENTLYKSGCTYTSFPDRPCSVLIEASMRGRRVALDKDRQKIAHQSQLNFEESPTADIPIENHEDEVTVLEPKRKKTKKTPPPTPMPHTETDPKPVAQDGTPITIMVETPGPLPNENQA